jgi:hypothetical protein
MTADELFTAYYSQYRNEATIPATTDDEYIIFQELANEAINRWANYDGTYWKELFTTLTQAGETITIQTGVSDYDAPDDFKEAGGFVKIKDANGNTVRTYAIQEPQEVQFLTDSSQYCYFTGDPSNGYTLHLNPAPDSAINGMSMDYDYYKLPTTFSGTSDVSEMSQPYFIVHRALWSRFRGSRNPFSDEAKSDAEDILKTMQLDNNSGSWANPWSLADNSGSTWGQARNDSWGF